MYISQVCADTFFARVAAWIWWSFWRWTLLVDCQGLTRVVYRCLVWLQFIFSFIFTLAGSKKCMYQRPGDHSGRETVSYYRAGCLSATGTSNLHTSRPSATYFYNCIFLCRFCWNFHWWTQGARIVRVDSENFVGRWPRQRSYRCACSVSPRWPHLYLYGICVVPFVD